MRIVKILKLLGYMSIIEGIISSIILFVTTYSDEDLGALGIVGTISISLQVCFFSVVIGFLCIAVSEIFFEKKSDKMVEIYSQNFLNFFKCFYAIDNICSIIYGRGNCIY